MNVNWKDYLTFRRMVTPYIIQILFWIGVLASIVWGIVTVIGGVTAAVEFDSISGLFTGLCLGPVIVLVGILVSRLYAELLILIFRINETLADIKENLEKKSSSD